MLPPFNWLVGGCTTARWTNCDVAVGLIGRPEARNREVEGLRIQPLDSQLEVALERPRRGFLERQIDERAWRRLRRCGPRLF